MSRLQKMLAKSQEIIGTNDIDPSTLQPQDKPKTGVGLMAQLASAKVKIQDLEEQLATATETEIAIDLIFPNPWQPRRVFDAAEIQKLANSIAEVGLIQPVVVRRVSNTDTRFELVAGERRLRAHRLLGKVAIRSVVIPATDEAMAGLALAENVDREDLTAYEVAVAIKNAEEAFPNKSRLAEALGIARTELYQYLAFFKLPDFVLADLEASPGLLGRNAAEDIVAALKKAGPSGDGSLRKLWPRVTSGELDQGKISAMLEAAVGRGSAIQTGREIKKLFFGDAQAGSITRDAAGLTIKIRSAVLTPEREAELKVFVEKLFVGD